MIFTKYILLYYTTNSILYVYEPHRVTHAMVCFANNSDINQNCNYMRYGRINNNITSAFSHLLRKTDLNSEYFKIIYYYPNQTIFDTNWIKNDQRGNSTNVESRCENITKTKYEQTLHCKVFGILNLVLSVLIFTILTIISVFFYKCYNKNV